VLTGALHAVRAAWNHVAEAFAHLPVHWKVACYVLVPLLIGLGAEFVFECLRRRRTRRAGEREQES